MTDTTDAMQRFQTALEQATTETQAFDALCALTIAIAVGDDPAAAARQLETLTSAPGRVQPAGRHPNGASVYVDYAHTPDALKNVLVTINALRTGNENVITVVGCGGDRDKSKRPVMGHIASEMSNQAIFTSDNPRTESPAVIIEEMEAGVEPQNAKKVLSIENRKQAIKTACKLALANDIILVAGKGHESVQVIGTEVRPFDDLRVTQEVLSGLIRKLRKSS